MPLQSAEGREAERERWPYKTLTYCLCIGGKEVLLVVERSALFISRAELGCERFAASSSSRFPAEAVSA